jgi:hypothetical protein
VIALILAIPLVLVNIILGVHDQFASSAILYDTDGSLIWSLVGGGLAGAGIYAFVRWQLRQYMTFKLKKISVKIDRDTRLRVSDLISGRSKIALRDIVMRVVACNMEKGQYKRGHGTQQRTVSFKSPYRGVVLYEKSVPEIPPRMDVGFYFPEEIDFSGMFSHLYPPQLTSSTHGLDVYWEVQLLHPNFVDQELECPTNALDYASFLAQE